MKRLIPTMAETAIFAALAILCAAIASRAKTNDLAMALFALPIFIVAAWMGMRRSGQWAAIAEPVPTKEEAAVEEEIAA
jgi:thiamine transporter ThiT